MQAVVLDQVGKFLPTWPNLPWMPFLEPFGLV